MKPAYYQSPASGRDRWMVSYLDVLTILLILFVAMAAQALHSAPKEQPQTPAPAAVSPIPAHNVALDAIQEELQQNHLDVQLDSRGAVISLPQELLFPPGEDRINAHALATVAVVGRILSKIPNNVRLVGHSDTVPIHNLRFTNNWELAAARGLRLLELLSDRYGIEESRLSVESYGPYGARSTNDTPDGRANNRRVEIVILDSVPQSTP